MVQFNLADAQALTFGRHVRIIPERLVSYIGPGFLRNFCQLLHLLSRTLRKLERVCYTAWLVFH